MDMAYEIWRDPFIMGRVADLHLPVEDMIVASYLQYLGAVVCTSELWGENSNMLAASLVSCTHYLGCLASDVVRHERSKLRRGHK